MTKESTLSPVEGSRPEQPALRAVIAGATTEVGKTWATASAAMQLRRAGMVVAAGKPAPVVRVGRCKYTRSGIGQLNKRQDSRGLQS